jgi:ComEC/Rec2-related protein
VRSIALWRRHAPAIQIALSVALGQILAWFGSKPTLAGILIVCGVWALWTKGAKLASLTAGLVIGIVSAHVAAVSSDSFVESADAVLLGTVYEEPRRPVPGEVLFTLLVTRAGERSLVRCRAVDLPWRNASSLVRGAHIMVRGALKPVRRPLNPFSWDGWLWRQGISAECRVRFVSAALSQSRSTTSIVRERIEQLVLSSLGDTVGARLFLSMSLGYRDLLAMQFEQAFMRLGLTHLLVVSGYQVGLMYGFVLCLAGGTLARLSYSGRHMRSAVSVVALLVAGGYVVCIGAEMSAVRALIAAACLAAQVLGERSTSFAQRWGVALLGMQLIWPWCIFDIGVILTFAALLGIGIGSRLGASSRRATFLWVNLTVWICTSLVVVVWRGNLSLLGLALNLLVAAPWSIVNCTVGLASLALMTLQIPGSAIPLSLVAWFNQGLAEVILYLGEGSMGGWQLGIAARCSVAALFGFLVCLGLWRSWKV